LHGAVPGGHRPLTWTFRPQDVSLSGGGEQNSLAYYSLHFIPVYSVFIASALSAATMTFTPRTFHADDLLTPVPLKRVGYVA